VGASGRRLRGSGGGGHRAGAARARAARPARQPGQIAARGRARGARLEAAPTPYSPAGIRLKGKPQINRHALFLDGSLEVQDEGSQLLAYLLAPRRGEMVADFCAGAGGKTLALSMLMHGSGRIYAMDVSQKRLREIAPRAARAGISNLHPIVLAGEGDVRAKRLTGKLDACWSMPLAAVSARSGATPT
jgi:16S rRNA C967 or C1407 C5-methylase (RsmB/RsmF family)